jgi:hypothetical protein
MSRVKNQEQLTMDDYITLITRKDLVRDINGMQNGLGEFISFQGELPHI